jgi:GntR family transcriptional regulator
VTLSGVSHCADWGPPMRIVINRDSDVPIREQLTAQLLYLIGSGRLRPGQPLPSARALAQRLKVHRNTVSEAFQDPTLSALVEKGRGKRLRVREEQRLQTSASDLDALIDATLLTAQQRGYTLRQVHDRLRGRLAATPPDHVMIVSGDIGLRMLIAIELRRRLQCPIASCSPEELRANPGHESDGLIVTTPASRSEVEKLAPANQSLVTLQFAPVDEHIAQVRQLPNASIVAAVSVSSYFLQMARTLLAPTVARRHTLQLHLIGKGRLPRLDVADLVICDAATHGMLRVKYAKTSVIRHDVISDVCLDEIDAILIDPAG